MNPEALVASLVAKAKTAEIISREFEDPPPPPPPPRCPIPSVITVTHDARKQTSKPSLSGAVRDIMYADLFPPRPTATLNVSPSVSRRTGQGPQSSPSLSRRRSNVPNTTAMNIPTNPSPESQKTLPKAARPSQERYNSPVSVMRRVESLLSLEEMSELRSQLVATSSPATLTIKQHASSPSFFSSIGQN